MNSVLSKGQVYPCVIFILIDSTKILNGELKKLSKKKTKDLCVIPAFYVQYVKKSKKKKKKKKKVDGANKVKKQNIKHKVRFGNGDNST